MLIMVFVHGPTMEIDQNGESIFVADGTSQIEKDAILGIDTNWYKMIILMMRVY